MINKVIITNEKNESLELDLFHPEEHGIYIKSITGLGPGKANININSLYTVDGGIFASARKDTRNIVFNLGFMFTDKINSIEEIRHFVYKYFNIKKKIKMSFVADKRTSEIEGYVESDEPDIFSQQETTQISVICPDPWFQTGRYTDASFFGTQGMFEFPFSNESLEEPMLYFGLIKFDSRTYFEYNGDIDVGMDITIHFLNGGVSDISIINTETRERMKIYTSKVNKLIGRDLSYGDDILISTISGQRSAIFRNEATNINIISAIDKDSTWLQLSKGTNVLAFAADEGVENVVISFVYREKFGGI